MDKRNPTELVQTFLEEHRTLMRGLSEILQKVESEDFIGAGNQADELDQMAGPHIQFEEEVLYPEVGRAQGRELERQLRDEHSTIRRAIQRLLQVDEAQASDSRFRAELAIALRTGIRHAESCGTLISHLEELSMKQQKEAFGRLVQLRAQGHRWTELGESARD
jgi:hemerythrin-like domain-containing protein